MRKKACLSLVFLFVALLASGAEFIHNGRFLDIDYRADLNRDKVQPYWRTAPRAYSPFRLLKDVEADVANSHLKVKCQKAPQGGFKNLVLDTDFTAIPHSPVKISWRARGNGKIGVYVFEYVLDKNGRKVFLKRAVTQNPVNVTEAWKSYTLSYTPRQGELGAVLLRFNFLPAEGEALDIDITDVSAQGETQERPSLPATFVIPKLSQPPEAGTPANWKEGLVLTGFKDNFSSLPEAGVTHVKAGYDDQNLYLGFTVETGEKPVALFSKRDSTIFRDDSVEAIFTDLDDRDYAHFILNCNNGIFDRNSRESSLAAVAWSPDVKMDSGKDDRGYWISLAIPRAGFPVALKEDAPFKLNFLQTEVTEKGGSKKLYLSWSRACEPTSHVSAANTFHFPRAVLSNTLISAGMEILPTGELELVLTNPGETAQVYCEFGNATRHVGTMKIEAPKGASRAKLPYVPNNELGIIVVRDASGREIYRNAEVFKHRLESHLSMKSYLPLNYVELVSDIDTIPSYNLNWAIEGGAKGVFKIDGKAENLRIDIASIPIGKPRKLTVAIVGPSGESLGTRDFTILRPKQEPWFNSTLGMTDQPLPPFTPIRQEKDGLSFLQTNITYGGRTLPTAMSSEGKQVLAGPVTLSLDGKDIASTKRSITSAKPNRIEWKAENESSRWTGWAEEDGFAWYTVTLKANPKKTVSSLHLDIPVRPEYAKLMSPFPVFRSGGDMDGRWIFDGKPWSSLDFKQIFTLRNEYRGIELTCEDERDFARKSISGTHQLFTKDGHVVLRLTFIDKPVKLTRERTYRFGIQVFPAKPLNRQKDYLASASYIDPRTAAWNGGKDKALIRANKFRGIPAEGTLEWSAYWDFDPQWMHPDFHIRSLFTQTLVSFSNIGLTYNSETGFFLNQARKAHPSTIPAPKLAKGWHNAALTWKGQEITLWVDAVLAAKFTAPLPLVKFDQIVFGRSSIERHADFHFEAVKLSRGVLPPEKMGNFQMTPDTIRLAQFGKQNPNILYHGEVRQLQTDRGLLPSSTAEYSSRLEAMDAVGFKNILANLNRIFMFYGNRNAPYTTEEGYKAFGILCDDMKARGMRIYYGYSFGVSVDTRESILYKDYYSINPTRLYGAPTTGFWQMCAGCKDYNDFLLYYFNDLMNRFENLSIYTDNTFVCGRLCKNESHGCGYHDPDDNGKLKDSGNLVKGRAFAKRLYAITKLRPIPREHFMHSSGQNHAIYLSWADKYLCGEQYLENTEKKGWNIDLAQFRAQNDVTRAFGVPSFAISTFVPFRHKGMLAVAGLHDVATYGAHHHRFAEDVFGYAPFLKATTEFGTYNAEFIPYYNNQELITTDVTKQHYASGWKKPGRLLIQVSNLNWEAGEVTTRLDLAKLGLKGNAKNATTGEALPVKDGSITVSIPAYDSMLILVE